MQPNRPFVRDAKTTDRRTCEEGVIAEMSAMGVGKCNNDSGNNRRNKKMESRKKKKKSHAHLSYGGELDRMLELCIGSFWIPGGRRRLIEPADGFRPRGSGLGRSAANEMLEARRDDPASLLLALVGMKASLAFVSPVGK